MLSNVKVYVSIGESGNYIARVVTQTGPNDIYRSFGRNLVSKCPSDDINLTMNEVSRELKGLTQRITFQFEPRLHLPETIWLYDEGVQSAGPAPIRNEGDNQCTKNQ